MTAQGSLPVRAGVAKAGINIIKTMWYCIPLNPNLIKTYDILHVLALFIYYLHKFHFSE